MRNTNQKIFAVASILFGTTIAFPVILIELFESLSRNAAASAVIVFGFAFIISGIAVYILSEKS